MWNVRRWRRGDMASNIIVGLITGALSSWLVASIFYRYGRRDAQKAQWASQIDVILFRMAMLDPKRKASIRPGDGVDDASHALLCEAAVMASTGYKDGAELLKN